MEQAVTITKTIGRQADNDIVVNHPQVGRLHAKVTQISDHAYILEDMDSANGTWVNGLQVKRKLISSDDDVKVADIDLDVKKHFFAQFIRKDRKQEIVFEEPIPAGMDPAFFQLKFVWNEYNRMKSELEKHGKIMNAIGGALLLVPAVGMAARVVFSSFISPQEKVKALEIEFKKNYICPNRECGEFLGDREWEKLKEKRKCRYCSTVWVKK